MLIPPLVKRAAMLTYLETCPVANKPSKFAKNEFFLYFFGRSMKERRKTTVLTKKNQYSEADIRRGSGPSLVKFVKMQIIHCFNAYYR